VFTCKILFTAKMAREFFKGLKDRFFASAHLANRTGDEDEFGFVHEVIITIR
jgi:hypothetical protein